MTHIERFKASIDRKPFDRVPTDLWATPEMFKVLEEYLGQDADTIRRKIFDVDVGLLTPDYIGPPLAAIPDVSYKNIWGVTFKKVSYGRGVYYEAAEYPLANAESVADIERHPWPSVDSYDYDGMPDKLAERRDLAMALGSFCIGWFAWDMMEMSRFLECLLTEPKLAEAIVNRIGDFYYEYSKRMFAACKDYIGVNVFYVNMGDDFATQDGLLFSPQIYNRFFKPHYKKICDLAHSAGLKVEFHMCGSSVGLLPELIDTGIDILNPIQTSAKGMDPKYLKEQFGNDIAFSGGVDVQQLLPFATVSQVKDEVKYLLDTLGKGGGYIFEPSHAIQIGTPPENVVAMYEAMYDYYGMKMNMPAC